MSQRKSTREERNSMLEDIALFKAVCAEMSWDFLKITPGILNC